MPKEKDVKIIIAAHKKYRMPEDEMYLPLQVGADGKDGIGFTRDNTGDNISKKNPYFCELTGLYWGWKNLDSEYVGLVHYRRHFTIKRFARKKDKFQSVLKYEELESILNDYDIVLPKARNYYIENIYDHFKHTTYVETLDEAGKIIEEKYPDYYSEFENLKKTTKMHAFNMLIMEKQYYDEYCTWLFDILFELEKRIDPTKYDSFHARFFGRVSELLFDVWLKTKGYKYKEIRVLDMEDVNWLKKGTSFLAAKFLNKKYEKSF